MYFGLKASPTSAKLDYQTLPSVIRTQTHPLPASILRSCSFLTSLTLVLCACSGTPADVVDGGQLTADTGPGLRSDAGLLDAGTGTSDGGADGGPGPSDAGRSDAGPSDAGRSDAGSSDAGPSDAGSSDADAAVGMDGGIPDTGVPADAGIEPPPPMVPLVAKQVSTGEKAACELYDTNQGPGFIRCWGSKPLLERWPTTGGFVQIHGAGNHVCALRADGTGQCFSHDRILDLPAADGPYAKVLAAKGVCLLSALGVPTCYDDLLTQPRVLSFPTDTYVDIGYYADDYRDYLCVVSATGQVLCEGAFLSGPVAPTAGLSGLTQVSVGSAAACALDNAGAIHCWGGAPSLTPAEAAGPYRALDLGGYLCAIEPGDALRCWNGGGPMPIPAHLSTAQDVAVGIHIQTSRVSTCAQDSAGDVRCFGWAYNGLSLAPADVGPIAQAVAGYQFSCVRGTTGAVNCTGRDVVPPANLPPMAHIDAGSRTVCGVSTSGLTYCWGVNSPQETLNVPTNLGPATEVGVTGSRACAIVANGRLRCWGSDADNGTLAPSGSGYEQISLDGNTACGRAGNGRVRCWGSGISRWGIYPPSGLVAVDIGVGQHHGCALSNTGAVLCWGDNDRGQTDVPMGLTGVAGVDAGGDTSCVVLNDGSVNCWGAHFSSATIIFSGWYAETVSVGERNICITTDQGNLACTETGNGSRAIVGQ